MSSTILYKFRSGTTYEALPLPGSSARLFDVKKAIVIAKKLDAGTMEFDLSVRNASTNEEYNDESMILPRGTRLIVQRLPAAKGQGFLTRMARNQYGMPGGQVSGPTPGNSGGAPSGFYTIDSRVNEDDEEFITSAGGVNDEDKELAALKAVTDTATATATAGGMRPNTSNFGRSGGPAGQGPPPHHGGGGAQGQQRVPKQRQNADPELRRIEEQEKQKMGRRKATGIPRTFLNVNLNPENKEGEGEGESNAPLLQPNTLGFEELKNRGGGQSESAAGTKKSLDYALKVTATTIPDYLQCALCHSVALTAMFLTWDPEGRTTCDKCIRDALTQNGFRDPLTGMEGISPDDLRPNPGIRKAAEAFVKEVMDKIEEIEKQQVDEEPTEESANASKSGNLLEGDSGGVVVTKRNSITKRKAKEEEDPFGGDDDFGGDVFAVAADEKPDEEAEVGGGGDGAAATKDAEEKTSEGASPEKAEQPKDNESNADADNTSPNAKEDSPQVDKNNEQKEESPAPSKPDRRGESRQRRGPPAGYQMGPAGGATSAAVAVPQAPATRDRNGSDDYSANSSQGGRGGRGRGHHSPPGRGGRGRNDRGGFRGGRGGRGRGFRGGRFQEQQGRGDWDNHSSSRDNDHASRSLPRDDFSNGGDSDGRSSKRPRHDSAEYESGNRKQDWDDRSGGDYGGVGYHGPQGTYNQGGAGYHGQPWEGGGRGGWEQSGGRGGWDQSGGRGGWEQRRGGRGGGRDFGPPGRGPPPSYGGRGRGGWDRGGPGGGGPGGGRGYDAGPGFGGGGRRGFRGGRGRRGRY